MKFAQIANDITDIKAIIAAIRADVHQMAQARPNVMSTWAAPTVIGLVVGFVLVLAAWYLARYHGTPSTTSPTTNPTNSSSPLAESSAASQDDKATVEGAQHNPARQKPNVVTRGASRKEH
ncbi:hypothetical protein SEUCBS139899_010051 [Sporothrix eucalyptigena]